MLLFYGKKRNKYYDLGGLMRIQLSDHFTYRKLIRFVLPSVVMMVCTSLYSIVDGLFVSNFVGKTPFAAINLTMPLLMGLAPLDS